MTVDLNADVGEGGAADVALMSVVTSVNIACGVHAGSHALMEATLARARERGLAVGAHPGYPDRAGGGRRDVHMSLDDVTALVADQVGALDELARATGVRLAHVKPHGALYNRAVHDEALAAAVVKGICLRIPGAAVFAPPHSALLRAATGAGLRGVREAFADRAYLADGRLVPRTDPGALITEPTAVVERARRLVVEGLVATLDGDTIPVPCDTLCVHADTPGSAQLAVEIRAALTKAGVRLVAPA